MNYANFSKKFSTISAINMLPFEKDTKAINWTGLEENIEFLLENKMEVLVPNGNTGEFYALTVAEAKEATNKVVELVAGRATVMAGIGYAVDTAIELGKAAQESGADCVMIHQPIHPYITSRGAVTYFKTIIEALDIPSIIYFKDPHLSDEVLQELAPLEKLVGVKYAINDLPRFAKLVQTVPKEYNIAWICGTAEKWAPFFYNAGAVGFTSGLVNVYPEKSLELLNALREGNQETVWKVWNEVLPFEDLRAKYNNGNNVVVIKEAMEQLGLTAGVTREPVDPLNEEDKREVAELLESWEIGLSRIV
ncbi:dihydrodipicolinate synthase [Planococcus donghaensis MPA1U2]|uniref:Dihydrodipicolinate synthase n=1 Tax=Planococcus donghaensis MPA1U2 TaxID=933115 RepID=E7RHV5_9BACL|nr:dihydrodipicolinate synthase family protein [Planococcus donghaensis]EGA89385.1 dihydrodipicolinate synthase [Planococcus donghaensis MPA1U2]